MASFVNSEVELAKIPTTSTTTLRSRSLSTAEITPVEPDLESGSSSVSCRICLEDDTIEGDELIAPCRCKGTQHFVHRQCLDKWRSEKEGLAFEHCTTCKAAFQLQMKEVEYHIITRIKHKLIVAGDMFFRCLILQLVIAMLAGSIFFVNYNSFIQNIVNEYYTLDDTSQNSVHFYYSIAIVCSVFVLGCICIATRAAPIANAHLSIAAAINIYLLVFMLNIIPHKIMIFTTVIIIFMCGIGYGIYLAITAVRRSWHKHYEILFKRDFTKVYVVVDQRGHYTPPTTSPITEQHRRYLNLL